MTKASSLCSRWIAARATHPNFALSVMPVFYRDGSKKAALPVLSRACRGCQENLLHGNNRYTVLALYYLASDPS